MTSQKLTPEMIERMGLNQRVMNELVNDTMIVQAAGREGLKVGDDELRSRIQDMREFQEDGRFSRALPPHPQAGPARARDLRGRDAPPARPQEDRGSRQGRNQGLRRRIAEAYSARNQRVRMAWASLEVAPLMAGVTVPDADLEPYVKAHQALFTRPERRRIQYVVLAPPVPPQSVADRDAQTDYEENAAEYEQPRQVHVAHVLVRVPPVGGSEAENKAKGKIEDVLKRARAGEDFGKLAKEMSEDTANAPQGGDLGFVKSGDLVPQFEQAAFALKKGELAPSPVRTPFGYHAIKVLDVKEGGKTPFKDVADKIKAKIAATRGEKAASEKRRGPGQAACGQGLRRRGPHSRPRSAGRHGRPRRAHTRLGARPQGRRGGLRRVRRRHVGADQGGDGVCHRQGRAAVSGPGVPPLDEIKARVVDAIKRERAEAIAMDRAKALVAALAKGGDFLTTAKADGFATGETPLFSRAEPPKEARLPGGVMVAALQTRRARRPSP